MNNLSFFDDKKKLRVFCDRNNISFLGLFGSYARGTATKESDIDLLVKFNQPVDFFDVLETEEQLGGKLHQSVDLVTQGSISTKIFPYIQKNLVTLYERA